MSFADFFDYAAPPSFPLFLVPKKQKEKKFQVGIIFFRLCCILVQVEMDINITCCRSLSGRSQSSFGSCNHCVS
jgi:hypothetical protein